MSVSCTQKYEMFNSERLKTSAKPLTFQKTCQDVIDDFPASTGWKTLKHVFSFVSVEQTGVTPLGRMNKVFLLLTCCILNSALEKHIRPIFVLHLSWDLTATICHRYFDPKLRVPTLSVPPSKFFAFLIKEHTVSEEGMLVLLWNKKVSEPDYITGKHSAK